jgi:CRP-like cAMP-binding protein
MDLPAHGFFGQLSPSAAKALEDAGRRVRYRSGGAVFVEGEGSGSVSVVLEGRVKVYSTAASGRGALLAIRRPGDLLGEFAVIDDRPRSASARAMEPVVLLTIAADRFLTLVDEEPGIALPLLRSVVAKLREADRIRTQFASQDVSARLAARLAELAADYGVPEDGGIRIDLPITQLELAEWVGGSREAVTKALHALRNRGLVETGRRTITVRDLDGLHARAASGA